VPQGPPDLSNTARRFASLHTRRRYSAPTTSMGLEIDSAPVDTPVWVHSWPEPGVTLERLPEGLEGRDVLGGTAAATVGGTAELLTADATAPARPDSLVISGIEYEVVESAPRRVGPDGVVTWSSFVVARVER